MAALSDRIRWILDHRTGPDGEPWNAKSLSVAARLGSAGHVGMMLRGAVRTPAAETLSKIAHAAGVSLQWLATGEGAPDDHPELIDPPAPDDVPPDSRDTGFVSPKFKNLPNWSRLVDAARSMDASLPAWVWEQLGESSPFLVGPASPGLVLSCAKVVREYGTPPPGAGRR